MKLIKFLLTIIILAALAVGFTPLDLYYDKISKNLRPIKLENITGSAVKGSAEHVKYMGLDVGQAHWLIYPSSYNSATVDFKLRAAEYDLKGKYTKNPKADMIKELKGTLDWTMIADKLNVRGGKISGYFDLDFNHLEIRDGIPAIITGKVTSKELKLVSPSIKDIGEVEVVFTSDNPQIIVGQVNSKSTVINVSGSIYIHKNRRWEVKLNLIPMPGEYEVEYAIQNIGDRRRTGGRTLNLAGFY